VEQALSILIREALDHTVTITARVTNVKRYYVPSLNIRLLWPSKWNAGAQRPLPKPGQSTRCA
ncbi:MAG: hypothetical protein M3466_20265, partial [Gemmatimonadota bacterium]|nr:hypothetical protein [Gemmatimonadota bacterium]